MNSCLTMTEADRAPFDAGNWNKDLGMAYDELVEKISLFEPHSLSEQEQASLLVRSDSKYLVNIKDLALILDQLVSDYSILTEGGIQLFRYFTQYYDSESFEFFHDHHNGRGRRFKVRVRKYIDSNEEYFECKYKDRKGLTHKYRISTDQYSVVFGSSRSTENNSIKLINGLLPSLNVRYQRMTLMSRDNTQRITIDLNPSFNSPNSEAGISFPLVVILEVKQDKASRRGTIHQVLNSLAYRKTSFSKYCIGLSLCQSESVKHNEFNSIIRKLRAIGGDIKEKNHGFY